jgi:DNA-binding NtrC family response regulator
MSTAISTPSLKILVTEDDPLIRSSLRRFFEKSGHAVLEAGNVAEAREVLRGSRPDAAVFDYQLPDGDGLALLEALRNVDPSVPAVMLTAHGSIDLAVRAMKEGAEQFFTKPVELPTLLLVLQRAVENRRNRQSTQAGRSRAAREAIDPFLGESPAIRRLAEQARRVAEASTPILLQGESGTGKGLLARWIHDNGPRAAETFVDLNCAGLAHELLESELFGHEKGAFTGAVSGKQGLFEIAHRGTLFLDEIGDADLQIQPKLLKVLEEQAFRRVGAVKGRQVDVRLIAATHHDLRELVDQKRFRDDLFYRISAIPLFMPSLRDRGPDLAILARALLERISTEMGFPGIKLAADAEKTLSGYSWPGNIRELRNVLERAVLLGDRKAVRADDVIDVLAPRGPSRLSAGGGVTLKEAERAHIEAVLREEGGDVRRAAATLGLSRSALYQKIKKHDIELSRAAS